MKAHRHITLLALAACVALLAARPAHAAFPGLNGKIAWEREVLVNATAPTRGNPLLPGDQLWTMNPDGSGQVAIASETGFDFERPAWSADGKRLAIRKEDSHQIPQTSQIFTLSQDGSSQVNISNNSSFDTNPAWSPDGTRVVFVRRDETTGLISLWMMDANGANQHQFLTPPDGTEDDNPAWSPDGSTIAFTHFAGGQVGPGQIWIAGADGSNPHNISNNSDNDDHPNWSPDGRLIAFDKTANDDFDTNGSGIWAMGADGSAPHALTTPLPGFGAGSFSDFRPAYSPEGKLITFQRENDDDGSPLLFQDTIMVANADGSGAHGVSNPDSSTTDIKPDWQPVASVTSSAQLATACATSGAVAVHVSDAVGNKSPAKAVHFKLDGGAEQVVPTDAAGNATLTVPNGTHTIEYWGENQAGDQEAQHHTGTMTVDTVHKCAPTVAVAGVRRACVSRKTLSVRVRIASANALKSVTVFLDGKRVGKSKSRSFRVKLNLGKLKAGRHRLRIVAVDQTGKTVTIKRTISRCAVVKPRRRAAPRFTG